MSSALRSSYRVGRQLADDPVVWLVDEFLSAAECRQIIEGARDKLSPAKVSRLGVNSHSDKRTNSVAWLPHGFDTTVRTVVDRVSAFVGLPADHAEHLQVIHYASAQEYRAHFDAWDTSTDKGREKTADGGNRILTALIYLNTVPCGGATAFPALDIEIVATAGTLCIFHDLLDDGPARHPNALHAGLPVEVGEKWACNLWFRERSYPRWS